MKSKILLVDDSHINREYLRLLLEENDFEISEADSGAAALDYLQASKPDLMILDLTMPNIDGLDTLRRVRNRGFEFPIVIFTSSYKEGTREECLKAGANEVVNKPSKPHNLLLVINKLLSGAVKN